MYIARQLSFAPRANSHHLVLSSQAIAPIAAAADAVLFLTASAAATVLYHLYATNGPATASGSFSVGLTAAFLFVVTARAQGLYRFRVLIAPARHLLVVALLLAVTFLLLTFILFLLKAGAEYSRATIIVFAALATILVPAGRLAVGVAARAGIRSGAVRGRPVVTLGDSTEMASLSPTDLLQFGIDEVARVVLVGGSTDGRLSESDRDRVSQAIDASRERRALEFALVLPWGRDRELTEVEQLLRASPLPARLYADRKIRAVIRKQKGRGLDPYFSVNVQREPLSGWERSLKRAMDVTIGTAALVALSPLLLLCAGLIKLDSRGPVIFRQRRAGFDTREFVIFKFRTMTVMEDSGSIVQTKRDDTRVTRVGKFLRRTSIDELPQLINVVRGEMSLVGPRPHALAHDDQYKACVDNYALRHHVKPGLTGAAQVAGLRGETRHLEQMERRVERDLWYINNWSLTLDLKIMAQTCVALLRDDAY